MTTSARLALDGGRPIRAAMLPYGRQAIDEADVDAVVTVLRSGWLTTGPAVAEFEAAFAKATGVAEAVALANGTAALHAAAFGAGIASGDEVITTPMTFAATANCVRYQGGTVVFADVRADTLNLDPSAVESLVTPRTKAIIAVDYAGQPCDLDELAAVADRHGLALLEDASHALGATYRGRRVGGVARMTTFSLHPVKQITTGEGGMVTTDDREIAARLRAFRSHGITSDFRDRERAGSWLYDMQVLGYNYRLTDLQCALGLSQLPKLDDWVARRRAIAARYTAALAALPAVETPTVLGDREPAWHLYVVRLHLDRLRVDRAQVFRALRAENIGVNVHYVPVPWHSYYAALGYRKGSWPVAEAAYARMLTLPIFPTMTDTDVDDVVEAVAKVLGHYAR
ncbi:MAG TPA: UDP-4-amino-4,6-dideoxy-N-acetyl-beta-L-altrosamine transaminase [Methylomirabilota bacterium]|nr:UDP-4-amino-4,6-dideoxy-N-acetyl-beta-L-altrosamine transaminase [Methylomirabilota bacterium]